MYSRANTTATPLKEVGLYKDHQLKPHWNTRPVLEFDADPTSRDF